MNNYKPYYNIAELIAKHLQGELTDQENVQLEEWLIADPRNGELFERLLDKLVIDQQLELYNSADKEKAWNSIVAETSLKQNTKKKRFGYYFPYAAAALLLLAVGIKFTGIFDVKEAKKLSAKHATDLMPGGNKAVLTLANGEKIILDDTKHGQIARQQNLSVISVKSGEIVYDASEVFRNADKPALVNLAFNTIATPRGGQYEVVLADGTKVWLNSASSLRYPAVFAGNQRKVELTGEAYFEVAKNAAKPFIVKTNGQTVEVLGTHFNINSYTDEKAIKTTLLEGSIRVEGGSGGEITKLSPGQQAVNVSGSVTVIKNADTDDAVAWKNGKFLFHDADLQTIMRQLSRWYDVDVEYSGPIAAKHYRGRISRDVPISQVFEILKTSGLNFTINGRKIIVRS